MGGAPGGDGDGEGGLPRAASDQEAVARGIALRQLTGSPKSRAQLAEAMAKREVPSEVADRVLDRLTEVGLVDDAAFAEMLVRTRHTERGLAGPALAAELRRRGVPDGVAAAALSHVTCEDEADRAVALACRKLASTRGLPRETRLRRTHAHLARKGYSTGTVMRAINEALAQEEAGGSTTP
jgi:regulatory protein